MPEIKRFAANQLVGQTETVLTESLNDADTSLVTVICSRLCIATRST